MKKHLREESGMVTIEATLSLSAFMFTIVTILTIVNICIVQAKVGIAINATAKEFSQYTYLYSLTGMDDSMGKLQKAASENQKEVDDVLNDINTVFTEINNLGKDVSEKSTSGDISGIVNSIEVSGEKISESGGNLKEKFEELCKDPKGVALGLVKIGAADALDLATSRLIAAPIAKGLCKKNLIPEKNGDIEAYLRHLGVVPSAGGSYYDGLDFSHSSIFANGSNEIRITVSYDVKVIALLPIDLKFHFCQTAITHGWLSGEESYRSTSSVLKTENSNIWTEGTVEERSSLIRHQGIADYEDLGYKKVKGRSYNDVHVYSPEKNEFVAFHSMNPLYSAKGDATKNLDDISKTAIKEQIEYLCAGINDTASSLTTVETKGSDTSHNCTNSTQRVIISIPEDEGLKEELQSIIDECNTRGVTVELVPSYGNGARTTETTKGESGGE